MISTPNMKKRQCESMFSLSIFYLRQQDLLPGFKIAKLTWTALWGSEEIDLTIDTAGDPYVAMRTKAHMWRINLVKTLCFLGGVRYWFACPNHPLLGKRVGVLYFLEDSVGCRDCLRLTYRKQQQSYRGFWGGIRTYGARGIKLENQYKNMRVKTFRGKPTRRYAKWIHDAEALGSITIPSR
jgi:hypothetical protein